MRFLLAAGGTAGHINPALSIASIIENNISDASISFIGRKDSLEDRLISEAGYSISYLDVQGLRRSLSLGNIKTALKTLGAVRKAKKILKRLRPDAVIGTGGFVCYPVIRAAQKLGIPTALHESNAVPGLAVKMLAKRADAVMLNFEEGARYLKRKDNIFVTGNPLRRGFLAPNRESARRELGISGDDLFILSFGGSLGALRVNEACIGAMKKLTAHNGYCHLHACGERNFAECQRLFSELKIGDRGIIVPYIENMSKYMSAADIVICRAGAMTLSELAQMGKCAILIPSPNVTNDHQRKNAMALSERGAAVLLDEKELSCDALTELISSLAKDRERRGKIEKNVREFAKKNSQREIFSVILSLVKSNCSKNKAK